MDRWSDRICRMLVENDVTVGDRVALRLTPGATMIAAVLGVLKAGAAYVPIDPENPDARSAFIVQDSDARVLVGDPPETGRPAVVLSAHDVRDARYGPVGEIVRRGAGGPGPAYVIYTSGTTGAPKGVSVSNDSVLALLDAGSRVLDFSADDRWLLFHSLAFDFSVWEMWGPLSRGGALVVLPRRAAQDPRHCLAAVAEHRITVLNQTPTAFAGLADALPRTGTDISSLRYVILGGERVTAALLRPWASEVGLRRPCLVNGYGVTEATVFATFHVVSEPDLTDDRSAIGTPLPGFRTRVVGSDGSDVAPGEEGDLWLTGPQLSDGYLNRPDLDRQRFVVDRDVRYYRTGDLVIEIGEGELYYRGRADLQVKLRGYRIELGDIESVMRDHPAVRDAVVWVREFKPGDERLVCAFLPTGRQPVDGRDLRDHAEARLPSYMRPARYRPVSDIPRNVSGKTDRAAVAEDWERGE